MAKVVTAMVLGVGLLALGACSSDSDDGASAPEPTSSTAAPTTATTSGGGAAPTTPTADGSDPTGSAGSGGDCPTVAEAAAPGIATAGFPDYPDVTWSVTGVEVDDQGLVLVEVVPDPDEVGYSSFRLAITCPDGPPVHAGTYALDDDTWVLLATTDEAGSVELEPTLP